MKLEKYQGLKGELEKLQKIKAKVNSVIIGALGTATCKQEKWWFQQIPSEQHQRSLSRIAKILRRTLSFLGF